MLIQLSFITLLIYLVNWCVALIRAKYISVYCIKVTKLNTICDKLHVVCSTERPARPSIDKCRLNNWNSLEFSWRVQKSPKFTTNYNASYKLGRWDFTLTFWLILFLLMTLKGTELQQSNHSLTFDLAMVMLCNVKMSGINETCSAYELQGHG